LGVGGKKTSHKNHSVIVFNINKHTKYKKKGFDEEILLKYIALKSFRMQLMNHKTIVAKNISEDALQISR